MRREFALVLVAVILGVASVAGTNLAGDFLLSGNLPNITSLAEQPPAAEARALQKTLQVGDLDLTGVAGLFALAAVLSFGVFFVALRRF